MTRRNAMAVLLSPGFPALTVHPADAVPVSGLLSVVEEAAEDTVLPCAREPDDGPFASAWETGGEQVGSSSGTWGRLRQYYLPRPDQHPESIYYYRGGIVLEGSQLDPTREPDRR